MALYNKRLHIKKDNKFIECCDLYTTAEECDNKCIAFKD